MTKKELFRLLEKADDDAVVLVEAHGELVMPVTARTQLVVGDAERGYSKTGDGNELLRFACVLVTER